MRFFRRRIDYNFIRDPRVSGFIKAALRTSRLPEDDDSRAMLLADLIKDYCRHTSELLRQASGGGERAAAEYHAVAMEHGCHSAEADALIARYEPGIDPREWREAIVDRWEKKIIRFGLPDH